MSGFEGFPGRDVRAKLDHPVIDADAHVVECDFAHLDFVRQIAGEDIARAVIAARNIGSSRLARKDPLMAASQA